VTIDPADARDHDDAVSLEHLPGGIFRLGVHIADVSYYVREGSLMDREALARGTSVYLVNEVVPMLPERLSADLCSLRPHEDRLAYSVLIDLAADGTMREHSFARTVIRSKRKFAYEEVQAILDKGKGEMADLLIPLNGIAKTLHAARMKRGSLDFESPEVKFAFDAQGLPVGIHKKPRLDAHRLIEECMLLANRVVAEHIGRLKTGGDGPPFLYRVHDLPDPSRLQDLARFVKHLGFSLDAKGGVSTRELQKLLERVRGTELEDLVNEVALRAMAKAVYSEDNIGHFGLGFRHYTHFTSPIRRYPDLVVHRLLNLYTSGRVKPAGVAELRESLPAIALQSSDRERVAQEAERASVRVMQMEYMKRHVGDDFAGVITGVTDFGLFVELDDTLVQGLVRMRDLGDDYYIFDERQYALRGRSRGKVYRLGDRIRVRVVAVDPETRECDLALVEGRKRTF
jgi:ribonuclease R